MDELDALGVGDSVRRSSPSLEALRLSYDGHEARLPNPPGRAAYCLRREALDGLLQGAAVAAGAELRSQTKVVEVIRQGNGEVSGVVVRRHGDITERLHAKVVIGADGRNSTVAKLVDAAEYLGYDAPRAVYWAYWKRPKGWDPHEFHNTFEGTDARVIFPCDGDQLLIATVPPLDRARHWREDHVAAYLADIRAYKVISPHLGVDLPLGEVRGMLKIRYFFRTSAGPGWALIGDAGHHKEFVVGLGISDALRDARGLADAIVGGSPAGAEGWWRRRDAERVEMFHWSRELGNSEAVNALQRIVISRMQASPDLHDRFAKILDGELRPYDLVPSSKAAPWVAAALLRGEVSTLPSLLKLTRRRARAGRDRRRYLRLASQSEG